jgi:hypothetical protein
LESLIALEIDYSTSAFVAWNYIPSPLLYVFLLFRHPKISGFGIMQKQYIFKKSIFVTMHSVGITGARGMELPPPPFRMLGNWNH